MGGFTIWGVDGDKVTAADFAYDAAAKTLTVSTDKHFAIRNTDQATVSSGANAGRIANPVDTCLVIPAGRDAFMIMEGVGIRATQPIDIKPKAALTIILGDGTKNEIVATDFPKAALHCPTGASSPSTTQCSTVPPTTDTSFPREARFPSAAHSRTAPR